MIDVAEMLNLQESVLTLYQLPVEVSLALLMLIALVLSLLHILGLRND